MLALNTLSLKLYDEKSGYRRGHSSQVGYCPKCLQTSISQMTHAYVNYYTATRRREETDTLVQLLDPQCDGQEVHPEEASIESLWTRARPWVPSRESRV